MVQPTEELEDVLHSLYVIMRTVHNQIMSMSLDKGSLMVLASVHELGEARPSASAEFCGLDNSTISRHIKRLEDEGMIARSPDPADGRASLLRLTDDGQDYLDRAQQLRRAALDHALAGWKPTERSMLNNILGRLAKDMAADTASLTRTS